MKQTPKEKANELLDNYWLMDKINPALSKKQAKQCALIAVDECIELHFNLESDANGIGDSFKYWIDVKKEIEKL